MGNIFVPTTSVDQWKQLLADPDKQWKTLIHCFHHRRELDVVLVSFDFDRAIGKNSIARVGGILCARAQLPL